MQRENVDAWASGDLIFNQRHLLPASAAFRGELPSAAIDEDSSHQARGYRKEMGPVTPLDLPLIDKAQIRFVDEGRGLQDMPSPFAAHETGREAVQVFVDDRHEPVERITTTVAPRNKPLRDGVRVEIGGCHGCSWPGSRSRRIIERLSCLAALPEKR